MNARVKPLHEQQAVPRASPSVIGLPTGGLLAMLSGALIPPTVQTIRFACLRGVQGDPYLKLLARGRKPFAITPEVRRVLTSCFLRFMRRTRSDWPASAVPFEVWEWRRPKDATAFGRDARPKRRTAA